MLQYFTHFAAGGCAYKGGTFLGFPTWYHYLPGIQDTAGNCTPSVTSLSDIWLIVAAVIEILLRVAALAAIVMVIYGAVEYLTSQGEPEKTSRARSTIINALVGLVIAVVAAALVTYIAGQFNT